jgi:hypothetical protein
MAAAKTTKKAPRKAAAKKKPAAKTVAERPIVQMEFT